MPLTCGDAPQRASLDVFWPLFKPRTVFQITLLVPAAMAFVVVMLMRPVEWRAAALDLAYAASPILGPALAATVVMLVVAFAVNDSGIAIPAVALTMAAPLTLSASCGSRWPRRSTLA